MYTVMFSAVGLRLVDWSTEAALSLLSLPLLLMIKKGNVQNYFILSNPDLYISFINLRII